MSVAVDSLTSLINAGLPFGRIPPNPYASSDSDDLLHTMMQIVLLPSVSITMPGAMAISFSRRPHAVTFSRVPQAITHQTRPHARSS